MVHIGQQNASNDEIRGRFFSLILALLNKMSAQLFGSYIEISFPLPIFFDMMQCEFHSCMGDKKFKKFSDELTAQLNSLVDQDRGNRAFQEHFIKFSLVNIGQNAVGRRQANTY
ncbi:unnamed protein product [Cylicocyclus nassatus]|uniref:Dedicator of cytokinesis TPR repeats region domain-containing protein n=1 Tax=Cylicocyclus nassatus TaxID=53992 RepID=A0AA36DQ22_CYLNA|nr:unnamed protein product [Cylicocyclus nassatus]